MTRRVNESEEAAEKRRARARLKYRQKRERLAAAKPSFPEGVYFVVRNKLTGKAFCNVHSGGQKARTPMLYEEPKRAKQALTARHEDAPDPSEWEIVPVRVVDFVRP